MKQLVAAAAQMQAAGIFHQDLRAENILVEDHEAAGPRVRITDFGCGCFVTSGYDVSAGGWSCCWEEASCRASQPAAPTNLLLSSQELPAVRLQGSPGGADTRAGPPPSGSWACSSSASSLLAATSCQTPTTANIRPRGPSWSSTCPTVGTALLVHEHITVL